LYTANDLEKAISAKTSGNKTYKQVSEEFGIPASVIFNRIKGRKNLISCSIGRKRALSDDAENMLVNCLKARSQMGHPCDKDALQTLVCQYVTNNNIKTPFHNNRPGEDWCYSFMKGHNELSFKKPEQLQKLRKDVRNPYVIYDFYKNLNTIVVNNNIEKSFVFNADESGFRTDPSCLKAIGEKGKTLNRISGGSGRESISVLAFILADGSYVLPFIVFKGAAVQAR